MAIEDVKVTLQPAASLESLRRERAAPGEMALHAAVTNGGSSPVTVDLTHADVPSLVLEIKDPEGRTVLQAPPPVPNPEQRTLVTLAPGDSYRIALSGFLNAARAPGKYQVRFRHRERAAAANASALASDWIEIDIPADAPLFGDSPEPRLIPLEKQVRWYGDLIDWLREWWRRFWCWLLCLIIAKRCNKVATVEIDRACTETISNAPPPNEAWNGTYGWNARFALTLDQPHCRVTVTVRLRLVGAITVAQQAAWETAIEAKWSNTFKLCCHENCCATCCPTGYTIICDLQFVASGEHHVVNVGPSTTNMTNWSATDVIDVTHEFGHMLGNKEEYFTVDGTDFGAPRRPDGAVMNNPANAAVPRNFDLIRQEAQALIGAGTRCTVKAAGEAC